METVVTLQDVGNVVTFIAPGYFAIQVYSLTYSKKDRDFPRLLIESVVYSLPIVAAGNVLWEHVLRQGAVVSTSMLYALLLLLVAVGAGAAFTLLRTRWPVRWVAARLGLTSPNEDFVKEQLRRIDAADVKNNAVTVALKSGAVFSGTVDRLSRFSHDSPNYYYFANLAWFNEKTNKWDFRSGGILVSREEIDYIETPQLRP